MSATFTILILLALFFILEIFYFKIADYYNIIDMPNSRSSHKVITIRGGGIIFYLAVLAFFFSQAFQYPYFVLGLSLITIVSFLDDILTLNNKMRLSIHFIAVFLLIGEWGGNSLSLYLMPIVVILIIGTINAYNFMDGINGITGSYSLITIIALFFINQEVVNFVASDLILYAGLSLLVFNFFNFRTRAKCFAGDVGSVSIAFIITFLIGLLIIRTDNFAYILLLLVYGLDAATTIAFRLIRKENIFDAHRSHFYQYLANEKKIPHIYISLGYGIVQLLVNIIVVKLGTIAIASTILIILGSTCVFIGVRLKIEGRIRLLKSATS
ncbi:MraY family glycosyltransferase [Pedobacter kyonggii]|uniref:Glycosyltransferase family 4 protein n=1 Tax=Pedobacter kyonggii TaxID=1926871 RepID=A0A4V2JH25_9SPHI|nr:glycosyltransferase family 4 protein [Pedobacter kyonggii]TBO43313.1 glycosyltransferase family 4 protein [Pedobacter kyonggii]